MAGFKEQFSQMRQNTPKRVQWLLLVAAFVVVLILLTLVMGDGKKTPSDDKKSDAAPAELKIEPDMINWADVVVGQSMKQSVRVSATAPVKVIAVRRHKDINGFNINSTCNMGEINQTLACNIIVSFAPTAEIPTEQVPIFIDWHKADETDAMKKSSKIVLTLGAKFPAADVKPITESKPEVKTEVAPETPVVAPVEEVPQAPTVQEEIKRELELIAPAIQEPSIQANTDTDDKIVIPDACSDFAFPGYGNSGRQIGWIKPSKGAYYFHPFDDKDCSQPTGVYNPDNGIITDIKKTGKRIGTDAEHIGFAAISGGEIPQLTNAPAIKKENRARQLDMDELNIITSTSSGAGPVALKSKPEEVVYGTSGDQNAVVSTQPYDRSFVLRQYKPIPATIVSDVRADRSMFFDKAGNPTRNILPVRATVDRNVYADNGRTIILPAGTLLLGYVTGEIPGPYQAIGRMQIEWYQFVRPDGVEFNFAPNYTAFSGDAQGRIGVPGRGSTDYMEQFVMPMLTAIVPAAVNLIAPVSDAFVNQIDLDNNTVVQSGTVRSSELAKNEIITAWNAVAQKLLVDMMDNTVPPFSIAAGTRITVYSPEDLVVACTDETKKCYFKSQNNSATEGKRMDWRSEVLGDIESPTYSGSAQYYIDESDPSWVGQVRGFDLYNYCNEDGTVKDTAINEIYSRGIDYRTVLFYCKSNQYQAINNAKQDALYNNQQSTDNKNSVAYVANQGEQAYNEQVLGLTYNEDGSIQNPFNSDDASVEEVVEQIMCEGNVAPDANGCCPGEIYTDMGEQGFNCCPEAGGDCFPPIM